MEKEKKRVIIDCDPGIDDSLAIMLALSMETLQVEGITIVCGNSPVEMGAGNAKKVLKWTGWRFRCFAERRCRSNGSM